jgi:RNA polymerase sigma-70 factor (ECF subfamily)
MQGQESQIGATEVAVVHAGERGTGEFEEAVSRYLPSLYRRAFRYVGNPHDAEDAVQDALLSAYKHLGQFKGTAKITTWLTVIVTNSALAQLRRRSRHSHVSLNEQFNDDQDIVLSDMLADNRPNPEDECATSESHSFLMQCFSELSPPLRQAIRLHYMDGLTANEAARLLKISVSTMKSRVWRARTRLKRMMIGLREGEGHSHGL